MASGREWTCPQLQAYVDTTALENPHARHTRRTHTARPVSSQATRAGTLGERRPLRAAGAPSPALARRFRRAARLLLDDQKGSGDSALLGELSENLSWFFSPREPLREGEW